MLKCLDSELLLTATSRLSQVSLLTPTHPASHHVSIARICEIALRLAAVTIHSKDQGKEGVVVWRMAQQLCWLRGALVKHFWCNCSSIVTAKFGDNASLPLSGRGKLVLRALFYGLYLQVSSAYRS